MEEGSAIKFVEGVGHGVGRTGVVIVGRGKRNCGWLLLITVLGGI